MQYKLRDSIVSQVKISYAKDDGGHHQQPAIDCSAGSNPFSMPDAAKKATWISLIRLTRRLLLKHLDVLSIEPVEQM